MAPIDDAIAAIEALGPGEKLLYQRIADQFGVDRSTLARRHKGVQVPRETKDSQQHKLTQQQEAELVKYIETLINPPNCAHGHGNARSRVTPDNHPAAPYKLEAVEPHIIAIITRKVGGVIY
jgi:hypothetical protein